MYIKRLRTIWIVSFTVVALLLSSVATSAPLMSIKMLSMNNSMIIMSSTMDCYDESITAHQHHQAPESSSHCDKMGGIDNCCSIACVSGVAFLSNQFKSLSQQSNLTLITIEKTHQLNTATPTLYRPPIA